jgi:hypothetical protein
VFWRFYGDLRHLQQGGKAEREGRREEENSKFTGLRKGEMTGLIKGALGNTQSSNYFDRCLSRLWELLIDTYF